MKELTKRQLEARRRKRFAHLSDAQYRQMKRLSRVFGLRTAIIAWTMFEESLARARAAGDERQIGRAEKDVQDALADLRRSSVEERKHGTLSTILLRLQRDLRGSRKKSP